MFFLLRSILLLTVVSSCVAAAVADTIGSFVRWFIITSVAQFVIYNVYRQVVSLVVQRTINDRIREYTKQGVEVTCPCSKAIKNLIPIQVNVDNSYKCLDCNKNVAVKVDVQTFLETQPMDLDKSAAALDQVYNAVSQEVKDGI